MTGEGFFRWIKLGNLGGFDFEVEDDLLLLLLIEDGEEPGDEG